MPAAVDMADSPAPAATGDDRPQGSEEEEEEDGVPTTSAAWARSFRLLVISRGVSMFGTGCAPVALAFGVLALPGANATVLSVVLGAQALSQAGFVLLGGLLADRLSRVRVLLAAEVTAGIAWTMIAMMLLTGEAPAAALTGCGVLAGIALSLVGPTVTGLVADIVPAAHLRNANSTLRATMHAARVGGLAAAGPVVALVAPGWALVLAGGAFLLAAVLLTFLWANRAPMGGSRGVLADLRRGWREFSGRQWLWVLVALYSFTYAAVAAVNGVLGPLLAKDYLGGAPAWSLVLGAQAAGTLTGALVARWIRAEQVGVIVALLVPVATLPGLLLSLSAPAMVVAIGALAAGCALGTASVLAATAMQQQIPREALSRVSAYDWLGSLALAPIGLALAGPAAEAFGVRPTLLVAVAAVVAASLAALAAPDVRRLRSPR